LSSGTVPLSFLAPCRCVCSTLGLCQAGGGFIASMAVCPIYLVTTLLIAVLGWHAQPTAAADDLRRVCEQNSDPSEQGRSQMMLAKTLKQTTGKKVAEERKTGSASVIRLLCFAWTPRRPGDERLVRYARKELESCDRHIFFTDVDAPGDDGTMDWMRVQLPPTMQARGASNWLDHSNMIGVARVWERIFTDDLISQYDYIIHVELDHFVMVDRVRSMIQSYIDLIKGEGEAEAALVDGVSLMLSWGNAFVFNRALVRDMAKRWAELGAPMQEDIPGKGCPAIMRQRVLEENGKCEQDMAYPKLAAILSQETGRIMSYGATGCGQESWTPMGKPLPLACWQGFELDWSEEKKATMIRSIALLRGAKSMSEAQERCDSAGADIVMPCKTLYDASSVPILHDFKSAEMHDLAQQFLLS